MNGIDSRSNTYGKYDDITLLDGLNWGNLRGSCRENDMRSSLTEVSFPKSSEF